MKGLSLSLPDAILFPSIEPNKLCASQIDCEEALRVVEANTLCCVFHVGLHCVHLENGRLHFLRLQFLRNILTYAAMMQGSISQTGLEKVLILFTHHQGSLIFNEVLIAYFVCENYNFLKILKKVKFYFVSAVTSGLSFLHHRS